MFEGTDPVLNTSSVPSHISYKSFTTRILPMQNSYCDYRNVDNVNIDCVIYLFWNVALSVRSLSSKVGFSLGNGLVDLERSSIVVNGACLIRYSWTSNCWVLNRKRLFLKRSFWINRFMDNPQGNFNFNGLFLKLFLNVVGGHNS